MHVGECREIQVLAPDERRDFRDHRLPGVCVAGAGPRLDHGRAFPGAPFPLVIMQRRIGRNGHLRRGRIRPQPQVDAKHVAVAGALLQQPRQRLRHAHKERLRLDIGCQRRRVGIEKYDQIDVAGIIQLASAHLAHGEYDQTAVVLRGIEVRRQQPASRSFPPQHMAQRRLNRGDRQIGQRCRYPHHRPDPANVAQRDQQGCFRFHAAERRHHVGFA